MSSRRFRGCPPRSSALLQVEPLEDRWLPSVLIFTAPSGNGLDDMVLRRNGNKLELFVNTVRVLSQNLNGLTSVEITGASGEDDRLTIDFSTGGLFSVRDGIAFNNAASAGGTDSLIINGTSGNNTITMTATTVTVDGSAISFSNIERLRVNALAGADTVTMTGINPNVETTVNAGADTGLDRFAADFPGNFTGNLTVLHFGDVRMRVRGNFSGHWTVTGSGTVHDLVVDQSVTDSGMVMAEDITRMMVMEDMNGMVMTPHGTITDLDIGGSIGESGLIMAEVIISLGVVEDVFGTILVEGSGTIGNLEIGGSVGNTGMVMAEDITRMMVMEDLNGMVMVMATPTGSGNVGELFVGGDFNGMISVEESLGLLTVGGSTAGTLEAGDIGVVSAGEAVAASPIFQIKEGGVTRTLVATRADNGLPTPASVKFAYFYDSTGPGDPQLTVRVTNGNPSTSADDVRFDLSLVTSTAAEFDLARVFSVGTSGIRNIAVEGDVLSTVSAAALAFFGLPAGTPGGVRLPLDQLGAVAAQDNLIAGTVQAASVQAVAFGSLTSGGSTVAGEDATHVDAARVLASGTQTVTANDTFRVPLSEAQKVALFLDTGPGTFDVKEVLFADQIVDNLSVTAVVQVNAGTISTVQFLGDGGSIQTAQAITTAITSTGPLGDLLLSSSHGIRDVTAPSIFGNIDTNGPIFGTIQTTVGDLGRAITNSSGTIIGTTIINTNQGITGRIISRGNLISHISSQREFSGVIAAQGDIGVAYVDAAGQLVRFGGLLSNGQLNGSIVALGNILGDIEAKSGVGGRIAAKGRAIAGLSSSRIGILGNFKISGNLEVGSAIVSGGVIGDAAGGTFLDVGAVKGILAAKGDINGRLGNTQQAAIFENATGANAAAIDALFTRLGGTAHGFDLVGLDLGGLNLILADLAALRVGPRGTLTGPIS